VEPLEAPATAGDLDFLSDAATQLVDFSGESIYEFIASRLHQLVPKGVIVASSLENPDVLIVRSIKGRSKS
jgi:hypothetical protein